MDLLEMPSPRYRRENKKACWDINTQQRISLLVSPKDPSSFSENPCELQRPDMKKVPSSISSVFPCPTAQEELGKEVRVSCLSGSRLQRCLHIKGSSSSSSSPLLCDTNIK